MKEKIVPIIDIPYNKIAERVVVCGDPNGAEKIAGRLENVEVVAKRIWRKSAVTH